MIPRLNIQLGGQDASAGIVLRQGGGALRIGKHNAVRVGRLVLPRAFKTEKEESFVLPDRPADVAPVLIALELGLAYSNRIKEISRIEIIVSQIFECFAMERIAPRAGGNVHDCA